LVASLGDTAISAHQIAFNVWDLYYIPMLAIGTAMSTRIGHAIGAGWREGIYRAMIVGGAISAVVAIGTMLILLSFPGAIIGIYTDAPDIQLLATRLLTLSAFFILIDGAQIVGSFILRAYKETQFPFIMMVVSYWLVALPLGWWLGIELPDNPNDGAAGFWYATITGISVCTVLIGARIWVILRRELPSTAAE
jgi:MATE family multidrug resistance protein